MKKKKSQVSLGIVCALCSFLVISQFKTIKSKNINNISSGDKEEMMLELEGLKQEKQELLAKNKTLKESIDRIEEQAVSEGQVEKEVKDLLDKSRMILGEEDVKGEGIILYITMESPLLVGQNATTIRESELTHIINLLKFSEAEAISINDYRITMQTGIKYVNNAIWIGDEGRISPNEPIVIKAIGDIDKLTNGITFSNEMKFGSLINYRYVIEEKSEVAINKSNEGLNSEFLSKAKE
ncbi:MAG: DUF881 domain-containing protein [Sarcina sp.]